MKLDNLNNWMSEVHKQLLRGKQVLLYGNVSDQFLYEGGYLCLQELLDRYFVDESFQLVGRYDAVDGLVYCDPQSMIPVQGQIMAGSNGGSSNQSDGLESSSQNSPGRRMKRKVAPEQTSPSTTSYLAGATPAQSGNVLPPANAFGIIRRMLSQSQHPVAMSIQFTDKLVGDSQHQTSQELPLLILLKKIVQEAAIIKVGELKNRRNALVLIAEELNGIPTWLYKDNPLLKVIHVAKPSLEERESFYFSNQQRFHSAEEVTEEVATAAAAEFASLTDGLTAHDLHAIWRTSALEKLPASNMKRLVDYYKFGEREVPWEELNKKKIASAPEMLKKQVIGQEQAISAIEQMLISARVGLDLSTARNATKPKGVFFFVGPTGTGKTELAKALAELIFGDKSAFARFDMSEYQAEQASEKLTGSPPGYVGYGEGGQLTNRVLDKPFSILLFDEIEKAHNKIFDMFLQVLEDGRLTDSRGQTADFSQSVIIFTSNIGSDQIMKKFEEVHSLAELPDYAAVKKNYLDAVKHFFSAPKDEGGLGRPEILNRLGDNILVFDILRPEYIEPICLKFMEQLTESARDRFDMRLQFFENHIPELVRDVMLENISNLAMGGRKVRTEFESTVLKPLNRQIFENDIMRGTTLTIRRNVGSKDVSITARR